MRGVLTLLVAFGLMQGKSQGALLKICNEEQLWECLVQAEPVMQDAQLTFPANEASLASVCRIWMDMAQCIHSYTVKCFTAREASEFYRYFRAPMTSMMSLCTNSSYSKELSPYLECITQVAKDDKMCGNTYTLLLSAIATSKAESMGKVCCALEFFKDCIYQLPETRICNGNRGDMINPMLRTVDESFLTFVAHSCRQESHSRAKCGTGTTVSKNGTMDVSDSYLRENSPYGRREDEQATSGTHLSLLVPVQSEVLESSVTLTFVGGKGTQERKAKSSVVSPALRTNVRYNENQGEQVASTHLFAEEPSNVNSNAASELFDETSTMKSSAEAASVSTTMKMPSEVTTLQYISTVGSGNNNQQTESRVQFGRRLGEPDGVQNGNVGQDREKVDPKTEMPVGEIPKSPVSTVVNDIHLETDSPTSSEAVTEIPNNRDSMDVLPPSVDAKPDETTEQSSMLTSTTTTHPLVERNKFLGLPWMSSTTSAAPTKRKSKAVFATIAPGDKSTGVNVTLKNEGGSTLRSTSQVPLRVFMVWLSTLFV